MLSPNALNAYRGRSVVVTGGLGFIGSNLAHRLVEIGDVEVTLIDSMEKEQGGNLFNVDEIKDRVSIHLANLQDSSIVSHLVAGVDYVFNLAGNVSHLDSMSAPLRDLEMNCARTPDATGSVSQFQSSRQNRFYQHAAGLRQTALFTL